jgi:hypothetical protein
MSPTFFLLSGVVLILAGTIQVFVRPREPGESALQRVLNRSVLRAVLFVAVGTLAVLVGTGVVSLPGLR